MPIVHGNISALHAAHMPLPLSEIRQRITDIEERYSIPRLPADKAIGYVNRRCNVVRLRMWAGIREQAI